ncbi:MAG: hypothetical protein QNI93_20410 [Kiloniellales bacterium]|nr:hypothetical protein [Kiloniellales bacterium]
MRPSPFALIALLAPAIGPCLALAEEPLGPQITAQGFDMAAAQGATLGAFERLRVRIESTEGIDALSVKERSFEVDLATTLDGTNYHLFGLDKRVRAHKDVTLNFQSYLHSKIEGAGRYEFLIRVRDMSERTAAGTLVVVVTEPEPAPAEAKITPLKSGSFRLQRVGPGPVEGGEDLALSWKTIDAVDVTIRMAPDAEGTAILGELSAADYEASKDLGDLTPLFRSLHEDGWPHALELATANNAVAGRVLAIETADKLYIIKLGSSTTSVSAVGTTVTLEGKYKAEEK